MGAHAGGFTDLVQVHHHANRTEGPTIRTDHTPGQKEMQPVAWI